MSSTWIRFNAAIKAQGLDREQFLPYRSRFQPFAAWYALVMSIIVLVISGYYLFYPGAFLADQFIFACESMEPPSHTSLLPGADRGCSNRRNDLCRHRNRASLEAPQTYPLLPVSRSRSRLGHPGHQRLHRGLCTTRRSRTNEPLPKVHGQDLVVEGRLAQYDSCTQGRLRQMR